MTTDLILVQADGRWQILAGTKQYADKKDLATSSESLGKPLDSPENIKCIEIKVSELSWEKVEVG